MKAATIDARSRDFRSRFAARSAGAAPPRWCPADFLLARVAEDLAERLSSVLRRFDIAADLGTPGDHLRQALAASGKVGAVDRGRSADLPARLRGRAGEGVAACRRRRGGAAVSRASLDLVVSALALHFVNDLPGTLIQIRRALKPDGLFLAALLGGETLTELRQAFAEAETEMEGGVSPRVAPFPDLRDLGALVAARGLCPAGGGYRAADRALRHGLFADARSAPHGRDQCADRAPPRAVAACDADADGGDLRAAFRRSRRAPARHLRDRLAVRLGAGCRASKSRCNLDPRRCGWRMRLAQRKFRRERRRSR